MTISSTVNKNEYDGNGSTSVFPFTFEILEDSDLLVQTVNKNTGIATTRTDYTVSTNPDRTGSATFTGTLPTSDDLVVLKRQLPQLQSDDLIENGRYSSEVIETALDKLVILIQQMQETVDRSLRLQEGSTALNDINTAQNGYLYNNDGALSFQALSITETNYPGIIGAGADADKPVSPAVKDIYFAVDTNIIYKCIVAGSWTANSVVSALDVLSTLAVTGDASLSSNLSVDGSITGSGNINFGGALKLSGDDYLLDEDDMASDSATNPASQQSVKAYVDSLVKSFGPYETTDVSQAGGTGAALSEQWYTADVDGFVLASQITAANNDAGVKLEIDFGGGTTPDITLNNQSGNQGGALPDCFSMICPIRSGASWRITFAAVTATSETIVFLPIS